MYFKSLLITMMTTSVCLKGAYSKIVFILKKTKFTLFKKSFNLLDFRIRFRFMKLQNVILCYCLFSCLWLNYIITFGGSHRKNALLTYMSVSLRRVFSFDEQNTVACILLYHVATAMLELFIVWPPVWIEICKCLIK